MAVLKSETVYSFHKEIREEQRVALYLKYRLPFRNCRLAWQCLKNSGNVFDMRQTIDELPNGRLILSAREAFHGLMTRVQDCRVNRRPEEPLLHEVATLWRFRLIQNS